MSRKRTSNDSSTETPAEGSDAPATDATVTIAEPSVDVVAQTTFTDKVGQQKYKPISDPFGIASDNLAGVHLMESRQDQQIAIKFGDGSPEAKPSQAVIDKMKEFGWRWKPADRIWAMPLYPDTARITRIEAEQLYQEIRHMIRGEKGIVEEPQQGVPF
jgi:hypothetical protein